MTSFRDLQIEIKKLSDIPPRRISRRKPQKKCAARVDVILRWHYGNVLGTGETNNCLAELVRDLKQFCKMTGRDFTKLTGA